MKSLSYSSLTSSIRRIHEATRLSRETGVPIKELLGKDKELRIALKKQSDYQQERREFLKTSGKIGLGAAMSGVGMQAFASHNGNNGNHSGQNFPDVAIVGAGVGGLRTAHRLMQYGIPSRVYEANTRIGGRMYSNRDFFSDDQVVEWGGEFISTEHNALRNLAHQLNLTLEDANKLSVGDEETYFIGGNLYNEHDLMDEWVGGLYDTLKRAQQDAPWQPFYNSDHTAAHIQLDNTSAIDWLESIGYPSGHWIHNLMMTVLVSEYGIFEENSALNLVYILGFNNRGSGGIPLAGTDERLHVVGGNDLVTQGMADQLPGGTIETGRKLEAIQGELDGPYSLVFDSGNDETCEALVLAIPYGLIKEIDIDSRIRDGFTVEKNKSIELIASSDNGKIQLEFTDRHWDRLAIVNGREVHQSARAWSDPDSFISTWEGEPGNQSPLGLLVDYTGGVEGRNLGGADFFGVADPIDVDRILLQFEQIWPGIYSKYTGKALVSNWWDSPLSKGAFVSPTVNTHTNWWGAQWETQGNIYFAGEACDQEFWSYMNGAVLSGERVAKEIAQA